MLFPELPLRFSKLLENTEATVDETVAFSCELSKPGLDVTWLRDNVPLSLGETRVRASSQDFTYQLCIANVRLDDAGEYQIRVGNLQSSAQLIVHGQFPQLSVNSSANSRQVQRRVQ